MSNQNPSIIWFRNDLRLGDHPALSAGIERGAPLILLYILEADAARKLGGARGVWLHHSLQALKAAIEARGGQLVLRSGDAASVINDVMDETGADALFWNRRYHKKGNDSCVSGSPHRRR